MMRINEQYNDDEHIDMKQIITEYYENNNELKYAIKFCKKAFDLAQEKKQTALSYIIAVILKTLYVKNNDYVNAMKVAESLIELKPSPEVIVKQIQKCRELVYFPHYSFPKEIEKYDKPSFKRKKYKKSQKNPRLAIFADLSY